MGAVTQSPRSRWRGLQLPPSVTARAVRAEQGFRASVRERDAGRLSSGLAAATAGRASARTVVKMESGASPDLSGTPELIVPLMRKLVEPCDPVPPERLRAAEAVCGFYAVRDPVEENGPLLTRTRSMALLKARFDLSAALFDFRSWLAEGRKQQDVGRQQAQASDAAIALLMCEISDDYSWGEGFAAAATALKRSEEQLLLDLIRGTGLPPAAAAIVARLLYDGCDYAMVCDAGQLLVDDGYKS